MVAGCPNTDCLVTPLAQDSSKSVFVKGRRLTTDIKLMLMAPLGSLLPLRLPSKIQLSSEPARIGEVQNGLRAWRIACDHRCPGRLLLRAFPPRYAGTPGSVLRESTAERARRRRDARGRRRAAARAQGGPWRCTPPREPRRGPDARCRAVRGCSLARATSRAPQTTDADPPARRRPAAYRGPPTRRAPPPPRHRPPPGRR